MINNFIKEIKLPYRTLKFNRFSRVMEWSNANYFIGILIHALIYFPFNLDMADNRGKCCETSVATPTKNTQCSESTAWQQHI